MASVLTQKKAFGFGESSQRKLLGVHPDMVRVAQLAIGRSEQDFSVLCGVRTKREQEALYRQGRTTPGEIVTWTLKSPHLPAADGLGRAIDLVPFPVDWNTPSKFDAISAAMFSAADELGIAIRWGADWDRDGKPRERGESDSPHFELVA